MQAVRNAVCTARSPETAFHWHQQTKHRQATTVFAQPQTSTSAPAAAETTAEPKVVRLTAVPVTAERFKPFGQVVGTTDDGKAFDHADAQLVLNKGTPRFYIMRLPKRGLRFSRITYHQNCTQCLGGLFPVGRWFMAVAKPSGSVERYPRTEDMTVFEIPHGSYIKLNEGTWHAGPLFHESDFMDFYNLELEDTNVVDHNTHDFKKVNGIEYEVVV